jgi:hypothetical protein
MKNVVTLHPDAVRKSAQFIVRSIISKSTARYRRLPALTMRRDYTQMSVHPADFS